MGNESAAPNALEEIAADFPPKEANLFERILWVRDRVTTLGKDSQVSTGGSGSYRAISHDKVTAFIRPKMVQAGIVHYASCFEATDEDTGAKTSKGRKIVQHRATFQITFCNAHDREDQFMLRQVAYADDYGDKAPGKAASYAMKYALLKLFMIETGEEDEERIEPHGGTGTVVMDDENLLNELYSVAEELFGDDAPNILKAMAERRFYVENYGQIPQDRFKDAVKSLKAKAASMKRELIANPKEGGDAE